MKVIKALALLILALPVSGSTNIQDIHLYLSIIEGEHSRDSNSTTTIITISENHLSFDQSYSGYRANNRRPVHKKISIKDEDVKKLRGLITSKGLLDSASVEHPTNSPGRYSIIFLNVLSDKKKSPIKLSGMTKEIEGEKLYQNVQALRGEIERIIDASQ